VKQIEVNRSKKFCTVSLPVVQLNEIRKKSYFSSLLCKLNWELFINIMICDGETVYTGQNLKSLKLWM